MTDKKEKTKVDESILDAANKIWMAGLGAVQTAERGFQIVQVAGREGH
jgi:hypothetical protein